MTITSIYAGVQQADVASMTIGGITYRCFVWVEAPGDDGPTRVGAAVMAEGEDGQFVLVDKSIVATAIDDLVDCPRVLSVAANSLFVVHWIGVDMDLVGGMRLPVAASLFRSLFDVTDIASGWASQGSVALYETCQYDHATIEGDADNEFIVSRRTASGTIATVRYSSPFGWTDIAWTDTRAGLTIADTVLACHANASDNVALVSYQGTLLLRTYRLDADDGGTFATAETFADVLDGDLHFTAVSHVRISAGAYLVAAEAIDDDTHTVGDFYFRLVCWRQISSATAAGVYRSHWLKNVHLESRLWTWASGVTGEIEAFSGWAFKTAFDGGEHNQLVGGVMRYDVQALDDHEETSGVIRPIPCSVVVNGTWDARPHGSTPSTGDISIGKRLNHLSHAAGPAAYTLGPYKKGVLFAHTRWARLAASEDSAEELQPVEAGIAYHQFTHEPPWTLVRDEKEPAQPDTVAWRGVTPTHALPIETPSGLVWTGGVTTTYDGYQLTEMGFLYNTELRVSTTGDDPIGTAGTYYYTVIPVWIDARGNSHRGPPAPPVSITVTAMEGASLDIRCINLTMKDDRARYPAAQRIYFEVYRTYLDAGAIVEDPDTGGAIFRLIYGGASAGASSLQSLPPSDHEEYYVTVLDGVPDSVVQYNELCPFQLDLERLLWTPPPPIPHQPLNVAALWQNRLFGVDPEGLLRWSEEILPRGADLRKPEFLDTNVMRLAGVDRVTGLVGLDNDLGLLHRDGVDQIAGDPGAGGSGNTLQQRVISRGYGCIEARSVCIFDKGATFQSAKRLHVLTRGSGVEDLGGPVEDAIRAGGNVRGVAYLEDRDELRFLYQATPGTGPLQVRPRVAVFNVRSGLWTTRVLPLAGALLSSGRLNEVMHSATWRGLQGDTLHVVLYQGGMIRERASTDTSYADEAVAGSTAVRLDVTTEWITMGLDSTKRYPEIGIITERTHAGPLTVESWYDHDGSFDSDSGASEYTLTVASPAPAFIRFRPVPSKCRAIKLRIYEPSGAPSTENVRLVAIVVHWMAKKQRQGSRNNAA